MTIFDEIRDQCAGDFGHDKELGKKIEKLIRKASKYPNSMYRSSLVRAAALIINTIEYYDK